MADTVAKAYIEMKGEVVRILSDAVISDGLKGIGPQMNVVFHLYDQWRKMADKEKL